jgi:hypothetical protein
MTHKALLTRFSPFITKSILVILVVLCLPKIAFAQSSATGKAMITQPVFQLDYAFPTSDKPQSKLWYYNKSWWALLPRRSGPSLWQRTNDGWIEHTSVNTELQGIPGRADCWQEKNSVTAVGVGSNSLSVFSLEFDKKTPTGIVTKKLATLSPPQPKESIETATIARDKKGNWWVAADAGTTIYTWFSTDGTKWSNPIKLGGEINKDDICEIVTLPQSVLVIWSDQNADAVFCREHRNNKAHDDWEPVETIEKGGLTADDHLNAAISKNGTLWLATKNSLDETGKPQLVLRVRSKKGVWTNYPYGPRQPIREPSRPVIIATPNNQILSGNTVYYKKNRFEDHIEFGVINLKNPEIITDRTAVIAPDPALRTLVNDITKARNVLPRAENWIILTSDSKGRVFEADLKTYFKK